MTREPKRPTLAEAWEMLGPRLGLNVEPFGDDSVRTTGSVRGRTVTAAPLVEQAGQALLERTTRELADAALGQARD